MSSSISSDSDPDHKGLNDQVPAVTPGSTKSEASDVDALAGDEIVVDPDDGGSGTIRRDFDDEELEMALSARSLNPTLSTDHIHRVAQLLLERDLGLAKNYLELIKGNYAGLDLEKHGLRHLPLDYARIARILPTTLEAVDTCRKQRPTRVMDFGCGPGRLAVPMVALCKDLGIEELAFNDLLPAHIATTRQKIFEAYQNDKQVGSMKITYHTGDITTIAEEMSSGGIDYDVLLANWFVTAEIGDLSSAEAHLATRQRFYQAIASITSSKGRFVEQIPAVSVAGLYRLVRLKTFYVLQQLMEGTLEGVNEHLLITDYSKSAQAGSIPQHIRSVPDNGYHRAELLRAGFEEGEGSVSELPIGTRDEEGLKIEFGDEKEAAGYFRDNPLEDVVSHYDRLAKDFLLYTTETSEKKKARTISWGLAK